MVKYLSVFLIIVSIVACSSHSKKHQPEPLEIFSTQILDDGTKLFVFSLEKPPEKTRKLSQGRLNNSGGRGARAGGKMGKRSGGRVSEEDRLSRVEKQLDEKLKAMIEKTDYCREGFVEIERHVAMALSSIRGECNDAATPKDRKSFING